MGKPTSNLASVQNVLALGTKAAKIWRTTGAEAQLGNPQEAKPLCIRATYSLSPREKLSPPGHVSNCLGPGTPTGRSCLAQLLLTGQTAAALGLAEQAKLLGPV